MGLYAHYTTYIHTTLHHTTPHIHTTHTHTHTQTTYTTLKLHTLHTHTHHTERGIRTHTHIQMNTHRYSLTSPVNLSDNVHATKTLPNSTHYTSDHLLSTCGLLPPWQRLCVLPHLHKLLKAIKISRTIKFPDLSIMNATCKELSVRGCLLFRY